MGESRKTTTENTLQTRNPYAPAQGGIDTLLGDSLKTYQSGVGSQVYQGPRVAGLGPDSQAGLDYLRNNAGAGQGAATAGDDFLTRLLGQGGATGGTTSATNNLLGVGTADTGGLASAARRLSDPNSAAQRASQGLMGGGFNSDTSGFDALNAGLSGPSQTQQSLQDAASGKFLTQGGNPYLENQIARSNSDALNSVKNTFSASGRYGSGMFSNAAADAISKNENALRYADYDAERQRQASAAQAIDASTLARTGARQGLYGASNSARLANAGLQQQGAALASGADQAALAGQQSLFGANTANNSQQIQQFLAQLQGEQGNRAAAQAGLGQVGTSQANLLNPGKIQLGVGGLQDQQNQAQIDAEQQKFTDTQNAPWKQLGLLEQLNLPIASGFGSQTGQGTTTQRSDVGLLNSLLGGVTGLSGAAANLGKAAPFFSMLSDERVKEDVRQVGKLDDGQPIYSFRYAGSPETQIGLLAQEVRDEHPEAVAQRPDGLLAVDYKVATDDAARNARNRKSERNERDGRVSPAMLRRLLGATGAAM